MPKKACELTKYQQPGMVETLAAAYAEAGRFPEAVAFAEKARDIALASSQNETAAKSGDLLKLFQSGRPFRQPLPAGTPEAKKS